MKKILFIIITSLIILILPEKVFATNEGINLTEGKVDMQGNSLPQLILNEDITLNFYNGYTYWKYEEEKEINYFITYDVDNKLTIIMLADYGRYETYKYYMNYKINEEKNFLIYKRTNGTHYLNSGCNILQKYGTSISIANNAEFTDMKSNNIYNYPFIIFKYNEEENIWQKSNNGAGGGSSLGFNFYGTNDPIILYSTIDLYIHYQEDGADVNDRDYLLKAKDSINVSMNVEKYENINSYHGDFNFLGTNVNNYIEFENLTTGEKKTTIIEEQMETYVYTIQHIVNNENIKVYVYNDNTKSNKLYEKIFNINILNNDNYIDILDIGLKNNNNYIKFKTTTNNNNYSCYYKQANNQETNINCNEEIELNYNINTNIEIIIKNNNEIIVSNNINLNYIKNLIYMTINTQFNQNTLQYRLFYKVYNNQNTDILYYSFDNTNWLILENKDSYIDISIDGYIYFKITDLNGNIIYTTNNYTNLTNIIKNTSVNNITSTLNKIGNVIKNNELFSNFKNIYTTFINSKIGNYILFLIFGAIICYIIRAIKK